MAYLPCATGERWSWTQLRWSCKRLGRSYNRQAGELEPASGRAGTSKWRSWNRPGRELQPARQKLQPANGGAGNNAFLLEARRATKLHICDGDERKATAMEKLHPAGGKASSGMRKKLPP